MELSFQQVPTAHTNEKCEGNYWEFMMSQVKILPPRQFMGNSSLGNMPFQAQKTQRRVTGDFKKRAAPPASRTASMPGLSSEHIIHTPRLNNQNVNDRSGNKEGLNQYYSGSTKCTSNLNYLDIPFTAYAQRIQDSSAYRAANIEIAFGTSIEKVRIKNTCMQKKEYITLVTSDTVKYHQLPKRSIVAVYIVDENQSNNKEAKRYTENEKVNIPFSSVPTKSIQNNRLSTQKENHVLKGLSEEAGNSAKSYFSMPYSYRRAPKSEYATSSKANEPVPSAVISLAIREEASKEPSCASSICLQHAQTGHSHRPLSNPNLSLVNTLHTALSTTTVEESILDSTIHCRKGKTLTKSRKGFSSITITARRIMSPANKFSKRTVSASTDEKNTTAHDRSVKVLKNFKSCEFQENFKSHFHTDNAREFLSDGYTATGKCSEPRSVLHSTEDRPSSLKIDSRLPETLLLSNNDDKTRLAQQFHSIISFSHFKVPARCFKSTYYLDKSLFVDLCSPANNSSPGLIQKATLSLKQNCTSSISSADGDNGTVKFIPFIGNLKQKVAFTMLDMKPLDVSLGTNDFIQEQISSAQKDCKTECQRNGHAHSGKKDTPDLPEGSAHLFIFLSNMNKGTNYTTTEQKYKCHQHKVQHSFSEIRESADITFHSDHVDLNGKRKDTVKQGRQKNSMIAKSTTGPPTVNRVETIEIIQSGLNTEHEKTALQLLTLQEALEMYKPDFISRSQKRLQQIKVKAKQRKVQLTEPMKQQRKRMGPPVQNMAFPSPIKKRQCTVPHPLSDNLFKPRERMIPEKEMQMRSKRIYNMLPEVKRRKEEEKKKIISQTNRLRAELFKKKLLGQILQRNNDSAQESS
ncbi:(E2-independent) E3 ubiquitin-conjugating enzyme FATS isoform X2 [Cetorhinus maximus]